jgi:hypothetical protein
VADFVFNLWLACYTQEEITEKEGLTQQAVDEIIQKMAELPEFVKSPAALHQVDFEIPIYNVWKQQTKTDGVIGLFLCFTKT